MKGLLLKDCLVVVKQLRVFLFILPFFALTAADSMVMLAVLIGAALVMNAFTYDERSGWSELARMMPYTQFQLVFSKYLLSYVGVVCMAVLVVIGQTITSMVIMDGWYVPWQMLWLAISGALLFTAVQMPLLFRFGVEKARIIYFLGMGLAGASGSILNNPNVSDVTSAVQILNRSPLVWLAIAIACNVISVLISLRLKPNCA